MSNSFSFFPQQTRSQIRLESSSFDLASTQIRVTSPASFTFSYRAYLRSYLPCTVTALYLTYLKPCLPRKVPSLNPSLPLPYLSFLLNCTHLKPYRHLSKSYLSFLLNSTYLLPYTLTLAPLFRDRILRLLLRLFLQLFICLVSRFLSILSTEKSSSVFRLTYKLFYPFIFSFRPNVAV